MAPSSVTICRFEACLTDRTLLRRQRSLIEELRALKFGFCEMETATLARMGAVYGFEKGSACAVIADRAASEQPKLELK